MNILGNESLAKVFFLKTPTVAAERAVPTCLGTRWWQERGCARYIQDTEVVTAAAALQWKVIHLEYRFPLHMRLALRESSERMWGLGVCALLSQRP